MRCASLPSVIIAGPRGARERLRVWQAVWLGPSVFLLFSCSQTCRNMLLAHALQPAVLPWELLREPPRLAGVPRELAMAQRFRLSRGC